MISVVIPDDYQDAVRGLDCFAKLAAMDVAVYNDTLTDPDRLAERFRDADALVLIRERTPITAQLLERLPRLRLISQTGKGVAHIDMDACTRRGVAVAAGSGEPTAPSELTFALILCAARRIPQEAQALREGRWQTTLGTALKGSTLGVFGYGAIGSRVAGFGRAFGMRVLVWGRETTLTKARADGYAAARDQAQLFAESDFVTLHLRLNEETRGIVGADDLARMKPGATLVNVSRAGLVAPGALVTALARGRPGYAALDVYEEEPLPGNDPLLALPNAILTPHLGYVEKASYELYFGQAFDAVTAFFSGAPIGIVNAAALGARA